jgi:hypothetical protein
MKVSAEIQSEETYKIYWMSYWFSFILEKIKELIGMSKIFEMLKEDAKVEIRVEIINERNAEIAKSMLRDGEPYEKVIKYTGLTREELEGLVA